MLQQDNEWESNFYRTSQYKTRFFEGDEVKIDPDNCQNLRYGDLENISSLKRARGVIIECDWDKHVKNEKGEKVGALSYHVEFNDKAKTKEWFLVSELILM